MDTRGFKFCLQSFQLLWGSELWSFRVCPGQRLIFEPIGRRTMIPYKAFGFRRIGPEPGLQDRIEWRVAMFRLFLLLVGKT